MTLHNGLKPIIKTRLGNYICPFCKGVMRVNSYGSKYGYNCGCSKLTWLGYSHNKEMLAIIQMWFVVTEKINALVTIDFEHSGEIQFSNGITLRDIPCVDFDILNESALQEKLNLYLTFS